MISAVVLTRNEETNITDCLKSLSWCNEIIVIDDCSSDKTVDIAQKMGAKVYKRLLNKDFSSQRNFGLEKAKGDWVLFVDADESISRALALEIKQKAKNNKQSLALRVKQKTVGFYIKRHDVMWGKELKYGEQRSVRLLRLAKKNSGRWQRRVHEVWNVQGKIGDLENPILHYPHQTLREFISDVEFYSTLHAQANYDEGKRSNIIKIMFYPPAKFIQNWIFRLGFLDGTAGFIVAALMSFHSYLAWSKLWCMQQRH